MADLVTRLGLDSDTTPSVSWRVPAGPRETLRTQLARIEAWLRAAAVDRALAWVLDCEQSDIGVDITIEAADHLVSPAATAQASRGSVPLDLSTVFRAHYVDAANGDGVLTLKVSHLIADAVDARDLFVAATRFLAGDGAALGMYTFESASALELYAVPGADEAAVGAMLGEVPDPVRPGLGGLGEVATAVAQVGAEHRFDTLLAALARAVEPIVGPDQIWTYPYTRRRFRDRRGYFAEIKSIRIPTSVGDLGATVSAARTRAESLGRYSEGDFPALARRLAQSRSPRLVLSDTSFYRVPDSPFEYLPTYSRRSLDDIRFLWDRSPAADGELRVQYKRRFLNAHEAGDLTHRIERFIA
ncbi:hypothetical protein [Kineosporia babensis]|uniref:Condensation domain-containing protein n=1 Tax=Kineosporia babensis TaxID=499548 RepID=A0A9X1NNI8_9ACTN|nr:hypothetical protein [Kineosporia babensis]MCD5317024.1 hypothetical protein [Kineosporia babensis]